MSAAPIAARAAVRLRKFAEQRSHQRYPIELDVEYRLLTKGHSQPQGSGKTRNISSRGVFIEALGSAPAGSSIEVMLTWPFLLEGVCPLRLVMRGRIVRSDVRGIAIHSNYHEFRTAGTRTPSGKLSSIAAGAK
jgi:hypothetical protein